MKAYVHIKNCVNCAVPAKSADCSLMLLQMVHLLWKSFFSLGKPLSMNGCLVEPNKTSCERIWSIRWLNTPASLVRDQRLSYRTPSRCDCTKRKPSLRCSWCILCDTDAEIIKQYGIKLSAHNTLVLEFLSLDWKQKKSPSSTEDE